MKHSNDTSGFSNDSFPSPSRPRWPSPPALASGMLCSSLDTVTSSSSGCEGGGGEAGGGGGSWARRGDTRPDGLAGTGGFRCAGAAGLAARRCSVDGRFAAGDGDRRTERSRGTCRGGGGDGEARALRERTP